MRDQKGDGAELDHAASEDRVAQENGVAARPLDESVRFAIAAATGAPVLGALAPQALERAVRRAVLDRDDDGLFTPSSFHARFEMWAFFEGWCDLPADVRRRLNEWELADYVGEIGPGVEAVRDGRAAESDQGDYTFLLLDEAETLLRSQPHVYLWPCNCRAMWGNCAKPLNVCLRFGNDRNVGWELTHERAVEVLREADRRGLMHTAYGDGLHGGHGICNCCADCCFPLVTARRLAMRRRYGRCTVTWPASMRPRATPAGAARSAVPTVPSRSAARTLAAATRWSTPPPAAVAGSVRLAAARRPSAC